MRRHTSKNPYGMTHPAHDVRALQQGSIVRVLSDLHLGQHDTTLDQETHPMRHDPKQFIHKDLLTLFLRDTASNHLISHLILNGDIVDNWSVPLSETPSSITDLFRSRFGWFVEEIEKIHVAGKAVIYVVGDHDCDVDARVISDVFGDSVHFAGNRFILDTMCFEHGHQYDLFNSANLGQALPLGYFASRISSTCGTLDNKDRVPQQVVAECQERVLRELQVEGNIPEETVEAVTAVFGEGNERFVKELVEDYLRSCFGEGIRPTGARFAEEFDVRIGNDIYEGMTLNRVLDRQFDFFQKCAELKGNLATVRFLKGAINGDRLTAIQKIFLSDILEENPSVDLIVFGHSHEGKVEELNLADGTQIAFANCGSWQGGKNARTRRPTVIEIACGPREKKVQLWYPEGSGWRGATLGGEKNSSDRVVLRSALFSAELGREISPQRAFTNSPRGRRTADDGAHLMGGLQRDAEMSPSSERFVRRQHAVTSEDQVASLEEYRRLRQERITRDRWAGAGVKDSMKDVMYQDRRRQ